MSGLMEETIRANRRRRERCACAEREQTTIVARHDAAGRLQSAARVCDGCAERLVESVEGLTVTRLAA